MKLAFILLTCLVGMSHQQFWNTPVSPRMNYFPYFYGIPTSFESQVQGNQLTDEVAGEPLNTFARTKASPPQQRFFFANPFNFFGFNASPALTTSVITSTLTSWISVVGTATTATIQSCIPILSFTSTVSTGTTTYSTAICNRRKRAAFFDELPESIQPTQPQEVEVSALAELPKEGIAVDEPLLDSSKDEIHQSSTALRRNGRAITLFSTQTVTLTSTMTWFTFVPTTLKKTINLGTNLLCLPAGFAVC